MKNKNNKKNKGFTIIETMISVTLFIIITVVGIGALLNANLLYNKSQDMRSIIDNLNFIMEDMSRNTRTGYNYHCFISGVDISSVGDSISTPLSCSGGGFGIAFESAYGDPIDHNDQVVYSIGVDENDNGKIFKSTQGPYTTSSFVELTSDEIFIDPNLSSFVVVGAESIEVNTEQPLVTIRLVGKITYKNVVSPFSIQTTVSQRLLDI